MTMFNTIAARLAAAFALVVSLFAVVGIGAYWALQYSRDVNNRMVGTLLPAVAAMDAAEQSNLKRGVLIRDIVSNPDLSAQAAARKALEAEHLRLADVRGRLQVLARTENTGLSQADVAELAAREARADASLKDALDLVERAQYDEAAAVVYDQLRPLQASVAEQLRKMSAGVVATANAASGDAAKRSNTAVWVMAVAGVLAALAAIAAAALFTRRLSRTLAIAVHASERIAAGDLAAEIGGASSDEVGRVLVALERMREQLATSVEMIRASAHSVNAACSEIALGNTELSARTEEQSASLEETSSAMQQLESTVRSNAGDADQASKLARSAFATADRGGHAMKEVVSTMAGIDQSSRRIAEIIGVIDGIAFQTNILALNAAVEAARAGEQGRGFSVVATEVRSLAQRSATAAGEIRTLIGGSTERMQDGTRIVAEAGRTMEEIVAGVREVCDLMGRIAIASQEQLKGIREVTSSVTQMESITQQNAALVEESAASAETMSAQAQELVEAVARFRTAIDHASGAQPEPRIPPHVEREAARLIGRHAAGQRRLAQAAKDDWKEF
jgi:methyl-accepting chemotaxis protein